MLEAGITYWADQIEIQRLAVAAWLAHAKGNDEKALEFMQASAELERATEKHPVTPGAVLPAQELLGDLLMELNRPAEALGGVRGLSGSHARALQQPVGRGSRG